MTKICNSLCDAWFGACKDEYYAVLSNGNMQPCFGKAMLCSQGKAFAGNGVEFCKRMGYTAVGSDQGAQENGEGREATRDANEDEEEDFLLEAYPAEAAGKDLDEITDDLCFDGTVPVGAVGVKEAETPGWKKRYACLQL
jgi:hypothetical protein